MQNIIMKYLKNGEVRTHTKEFLNIPDALNFSSCFSNTIWFESWVEVNGVKVSVKKFTSDSLFK